MIDCTTDIKKAALKKGLIHLCKKFIEQRIASNIEAMDRAQANANEEEKSSAGDKYETSRAMSHLEKDMHSGQLTANRTELTALFAIDYSKLYDSAIQGSFIHCQECSFFIAAGLGKVHFEEEDIYLLSPGAPLAKSLYNKKKGGVFVFNKKEMLILDVF